MRTAFAAGFIYFAVVFAAGVLLGAIRVAFLAPAVGDWNATLIELPFILGVSWIACVSIIDRLGVERRAGDRLVMGFAAFGLLLVAEVALGLALMNRTFAGQIAAMSSPSALIGLAGQGLFAIFPLIALILRR